MRVCWWVWMVGVKRHRGEPGHTRDGTHTGAHRPRPRQAHSKLFRGDTRKDVSQSSVISRSRPALTPPPALRPGSAAPGLTLTVPSTRKDDLVLGTCPPKCCWADQVPVVLGTAGRTRYQVLLGGLPVPECSQVMPMPMPCPCTCDCTEEPKTKWAEYNIELCLHSSRLEQA